MSQITSEKMTALVDRVQQAGKIARSYFKKTKARRKSDRSFVTDADLEIETFLRQGLNDLCPEMEIIGEEYGVSRSASKSKGIWAIDPIDGTESFVKGLPVWGISIGLIQSGRPVAGVFFLPMMDDMYIAYPDGNVTYNGQPIRKDTNSEIDSESILYVPSFVHRRYRIDFKGKTRSLGSTAAHLVFSADGRGAGALLGRPHIWDIAGCLAILFHMGGQCIYLDGTPLDFEEIIYGGLPRTSLLAGFPNELNFFKPRISLVPKDK